MIKILVFDLDGTLYNSKKQIDQQTIDKIIDLQKKEIIVGIATGRFYAELEEVVSQLKLREFGGFVASSNGLEIHDFKNKTIKRFPQITNAQANECIALARQYHLKSWVWQDGSYHMFYLYFFRWIQKFFSKSTSDWHYIKFLKKVHFEKKVYLKCEAYDKICFMGLRIRGFLTNVQHNYMDYHFYKAGPFTYELCHKQVGKLEAVQWICESYDICLDEVMAFGDNDNDVELNRACGYGVAMKNGCKEIKKVARYISDFTNDKQGVLICLNLFFPENDNLKKS